MQAPLGINKNKGWLLVLDRIKSVSYFTNTDLTFIRSQKSWNCGKTVERFSIRHSTSSRVIKKPKMFITTSGVNLTKLFFFGNKEFFRFSLLSLAIVQYTHFFHILQTLKLNSKNWKPEKWKFGKIDSQVISFIVERKYLESSKVYNFFKKHCYVDWKKNRFRSAL